MKNELSWSVGLKVEYSKLQFVFCFVEGGSSLHAGMGELVAHSDVLLLSQWYMVVKFYVR